MVEGEKEIFERVDEEIDLSESGGGKNDFMI